MNNTYKTKQIIIIALIIIVIGAVVLSLKTKKENIIAPDDNTNVDVEKPISLCYYRGDKTAGGFYDVAWLKINTVGGTSNKITGEFNNIPAEKDSKVGTFTGTILPVDPMIINKEATVWWDSRAEGMEVTEELAIEFGDKSATVGFGEMVDSQLGDGVYLYKDKTNLTYIKAMDQISCETLDEKLFTEKYIRDNIKTIATNKPVLGGSWYVISIVTNPIARTGEITYEDGHIQSKANFIYTYNKSPQSITVTKWEVKS